MRLSIANARCGFAASTACHALTRNVTGDRQECRAHPARCQSKDAPGDDANKRSISLGSCSIRVALSKPRMRVCTGSRTARRGCADLSIRSFASRVSDASIRFVKKPARLIKARPEAIQFSPSSMLLILDRVEPSVCVDDCGNSSDENAAAQQQHDERSPEPPLHTRWSRECYGNSTEEREPQWDIHCRSFRSC
jgi:hypothetical protein